MAVYVAHPGLPPGPWRRHQCGPSAADAPAAVPMPARTRNNRDFPPNKITSHYKIKKTYTNAQTKVWTAAAVRASTRWPLDASRLVRS